MAHVPEQTETRCRAAAAAEVSPAPDGTWFVRLATSRHSFQARARLVSGAVHAAVFCGPAPFAATFAELSLALASQGTSALCVHPRPVVGATETLACCAQFLRQRGARTVSLAAAGPDAQAALEAACALDAESVLLLAPSSLPAGEPRADLLRGRPLLLCTRGEPKQFEPLAGLPHATRLHFALASESFDEVRSDLKAACVPFVGRRGALLAGPGAAALPP